MKKPIPTVEQLEALLREQTEFVSDALDKVRQGQPFNIRPLEGRITELCAEAARLKPEQAKQLESGMAIMIGRLEELSAALEDFKRQLKESKP